MQPLATHVRFWCFRTPKLYIYLLARSGHSVIVVLHGQAYGPRFDSKLSCGSHTLIEGERKNAHVPSFKCTLKAEINPKFSTTMSAIAPVQLETIHQINQ